MVNQLFRKILVKRDFICGEGYSIHEAPSTTNTFVPFSFKLVPVSLLDILPSWACVAHMC